MNDVKAADPLRLRRQHLVKSFAQANEQAEQYKVTAAEYAIRLDEFDCIMTHLGQKNESENVIPMRQPPGQVPRFNPSRRYRYPGATTDIVTLAYNVPGITIDEVMMTVYERYKAQGTSKDTIGKMVRRMMREGYAYREGTKLYLTEICRSAWEASPLYRAS